MAEKTSIIKTVISGSFRKHLEEIINLKSDIESLGIQVLSPSGNLAKNPEDEFIILDSDPLDHPEIIQASVFNRIRNSTFLVLANFNDYLGRAATLEVGYAIGIGIKVYSIEKVSDPNIAPFCSPLEIVLPKIKSVF